MSKRKIMGIPAACFLAVIEICVLGICIGSFLDFDIGMAVAGKTELGMYFATFSPFAAYALLPAGGACLYLGLKKKRESFKVPARAMLGFGWFMAIYYSNEYFGKNVRPLFGYTAENALLPSLAGWMFWAVLYAGVAFLMIRLLDDSDPDKLIAVGATLLVASVAADAVMQWLKQVGSRPRPKYLLTMNEPASGFRSWWEIVPNLAGTNDNYQSWPSGHMSIVSVLFAMPLLTDCMKKASSRKNMIVFFCVCAFVLLCGYNRMHMTNHFLSDVCFGTLNTILLTAGIWTMFRKALPAKTGRAAI